MSLQKVQKGSTSSTEEQLYPFPESNIYLLTNKEHFYGYPKVISNYLISRYSASVNFTPSKRYCSSSMSSLKLSDMDMNSEPKNRTYKSKENISIKVLQVVLPITEISTSTSRTETKI